MTRTPGGSAAALAAGYVSLEFGSDIFGSLRCPAHFCGVFSHKPSLDLVPLRGAGPPETPAISVRGDLAVIGPMARSAADLALLLRFRVLVIDKHPLCPAAAKVAAALDRLADRLGKSAAQFCVPAPNYPIWR